MTSELPYEDLLRIIDEKDRYINELECENANLIDEKNIVEKGMNMLLYAKVSQIIQLEKEKAKLQSELDAMKYITEKTKKTMYEKDIHGRTYYVSKILHDKKDDGGVGDKVGVLKKIDGSKYVVEWF